MPDTNPDAPKRPAKTKRTAEQHRQLLTHHMSLLRGKLAEVTELRAPLKAAQDEFTVLINDAKGDLGKGYTRKYLVTLLEDATSRLRDLLAEEERRARDREALGLPVFGVQTDLFDGEQTSKLTLEARDEITWEAEGYLRGRNGLLQEVPDGCPPRFDQAVRRGYERGQTATLEDAAAAIELKKKQSQPDAAAAPKDLNAAKEQPEPGTPAAKKAEREAVKRAKESLGKLGAGDTANKVAA